MKKNSWILIGLLTLFVVGYGHRISDYLGLPGNIDILVKDGNGYALQGVRCSITNPPGCSSGASSCQLFQTSNSAGHCVFRGLPSGELYSWGVSCNNPSGITKQGNVEILASNTYSFTSNVYVTLSGCSGTIVPTTTTTTLPGCGSPYTNKCYNGDVWSYNSCGVRDSRVAVCGTYGCTGGNCLNAPTTTRPPIPTTTQPGVTTTTQPHTCLDVCLGDSCSVNANGEGFKCVVGVNGCRSWVLDPSCDEGTTNSNITYIGLIAGGLAVLMLLFVSLRRKR